MNSIIDPLGLPALHHMGKQAYLSLAIKRRFRPRDVCSPFVFYINLLFSSILIAFGVHYQLPMYISQYRLISTMVFRIYAQLVLAAAAIVILSKNCNAFTTPQLQCNSKSSLTMFMSMINNSNNNNEEQDIVSSRRSILSSFLATAVVGGASILSLPDNALAEAETMERGGVQLTPFNSLAFNYRGTS